MANEIRARLELMSARLPPMVAEFFATQTGTNALRHRQTIGTSEEALTLGDASGGGGWFVAINKGSTTISLRVATGAANFCDIKAGEACCFRWASTATAPFAIADTSASDLLYEVFEA